MVKTEIIENWQDKDRSGHLGTIQTYILKNKEILPDLLLKMYREILLTEEIIFDRDSPEQEQLLIIGIIKAENNLVKVSNRIYEFIFNLRWIDKRLKSSSS